MRDESPDRLDRSTVDEHYRAVRASHESLSSSAEGYEIHVPISPTPSFLIQVRYLAESVRLFGGALADSPVIVTVGADERIDLAREHPWSSRLGVEWRWLDKELWRRHDYWATALQRFCYDIQAPNALLLDADTLFVRPVDDLLDTLDQSSAIAGTIGHVSPFPDRHGRRRLFHALGQRRPWKRIWHAAGLADPAFVCEHTAWPLGLGFRQRYCPPYFNLGVLFAPREILAALASTIFEEMKAVERAYTTRFRCQLALTMAIQRSGVSWRELPLRFNLPNNPRFLPYYQDELADARILHYCNDEQFRRTEDFASIKRVDALLTREDLDPCNMRLCDALREIHERVLAAA